MRKLFILFLFSLLAIAMQGQQPTKHSRSMHYLHRGRKSPNIEQVNASKALLRYREHHLTYKSHLQGYKYELRHKNPHVVCDVQDSLALVALYNSTGGDNWAYHNGWLLRPVYTWYGVNLNDQGKVIRLYLSGNMLSGSIPPEIGNLDSLVILDLRDNRLSGSIPAEIGNLINLKYLYLSGNMLSGSIPPEIGNLDSLEDLSLSGNMLSGSIPAEIGNLDSLEDLSLSNNHLHGSIPPELGNLTHLEYLDLSGNQLTGNSADLSGLSSLSDLYVNDNKLDFGDLDTMNVNWGNLWYYSYSPQANVPVFVDSTSSSTQLTVRVHVDGLHNHYQWYKFGEAISGATADSLILNKTDTGSYYCVITNPDYPDLTLKSVSFGIGYILGVPQKEYEALVALYDSTNGNGWFMHENWLSDKDVSEWYGVEVQNFRVKHLWLSENNLIGLIPPKIGNLDSLEDLSLYANHLHGSIPPELGNLSHLEYLDLSGNQLTGNSADLSGLSSLSDLYVNDNKLDFGDLDTMNVNWGNLSYYSYSPQANVPVFVDSTSSSTQLTVRVHVDGLHNHYQWYKFGEAISGATADSLILNKTDTGSYYCVITNPDYPRLTLRSVSFGIGYIFGVPQKEYEALVALYDSTNGNGWFMHENWLSDKDVSEWFGVTLDTIGHVRRLDLIGNNLLGLIPPKIQDLDNLKYLSLSNNHLHGSIPPEIGNLSHLEYLYLSGNQLTGNSADLSGLSSLLGLYVNDNKLDFGDLDTMNVDWGNLWYYSYSPQANVPVFVDSTSSSTQLTVRVHVDGLHNHYQWYKFDSLITGATNDSLILNRTDTGLYYCVITNPDYPDLTLKSVSFGIGYILGVPQKEYEALVALYDSTNGDGWGVNENWLSDKDVSEWYGVDVENYNVRGLFLMSNFLIGSIPPAIGNLDSLENLDLYENHLSGNIPPEIGNLKKLKILALNNNQLSGNIPPDIGNLVNLEQLNLSENKLSGSIPSGMGNLSRLHDLSLSYNQLSGNAADLSGINSLEYLYVNDNKLDFGDLDTMNVDWGNLWYYSYSPQANVPVFVDSTSSSTQLTVRVHVDGLHNHYQWYKFGEAISGATADSLILNKTDTGSYYCVITNPDYPDLTLNSVSFGIGYILGVPQKEYEALVALYDSTNGDGWDDNENWLSDKDVSEWYGVEVQNFRVKHLWLSENNLIGLIPPKIGNLDSLEILGLYANHLHGSIPPELGNLSHLEYLDLSENGLSGSIPPEIGSLHNLRYLYLYGNQLSGSIPPELGNLSHLEYLYLSGNQLTGNSADLSGISSLSDLYVDNNKLDFGDLDTMNVDWENLPYYSYSPQDSIITYVESIENNNITLAVHVDGLHNHYQWYLNDDPITGATSDTYTFNYVTDSTGYYYCVVTNPDYPDLTLTSKMYKFTGTYSVTFTVKHNGNPVEGATITINSQSLQTDANGQAVFNLVNGDYIYTVQKTGFRTYTGHLTINNTNLDITVTLDYSLLTEHQNDLRIYPNPTHGKLVIESESLLITKLEIMNLSGRKVYESRFRGNRATIDLGGLPQGIYLMRIERGKDVVFSKVIKY